MLSPLLIQQKFRLPSSYVDSVLSELENEGTIAHCIVIECPSCHDMAFSNQPDFNIPAHGIITCEHCGESISAEWDIHDIYFVN